MSGASAPASVSFLGFVFACRPADALIDQICDMARASRFTYVVTPNVDHVITLDKTRDDPAGQAVRSAYAAADLTICDSRILLKLAKLSGHELTLLAGSDLTCILLDERIPAGSSVAVIGGTTDQLTFLQGRRPDLMFRQHIPPMGVRRNVAAQDAIADFVEQAACDYVFFTIGAPQSEIVAHRIAARGRARGVALCVGASIEFITGAKRRAPLWMQRASLEWAYRLGSEPRRLWRRYLVEGPRIFAIWRRQR
ncbi:WecB/TagA/CpsF family glycosyltransferase [Sphingomonas floccifaciens]|uniref:WecB/TagA/CpsF family glycosyltransferase n=1 Tax=Sphingomonas floccifaciens TaxID=1844115 RepID=A0ABW4N926_9SPHN